MQGTQPVGGIAVTVMVLAGILGGVACPRGKVARVPATRQTAVAPTSSPPTHPASTTSKPKPECLQCAIEDLRQAAHKDQVVVTARYLGLEERWSDEHRTNLRCTRDRDVVGVVRFALIGANPWRDEFAAPPAHEELARIIEADLPCPELSRPQYAKLYRYSPDDRERDGLGHAPVLRRGQLYRLTFVRSPGIAVQDSHSPNHGRPVPILVAVDPLRP